MSLSILHKVITIIFILSEKRHFSSTCKETWKLKDFPFRSCQDALSSRLHEMSVTDLINQREIFTQQIATSLIALNQVNSQKGTKLSTQKVNFFYLIDKLWVGSEETSQD